MSDGDSGSANGRDASRTPVEQLLDLWFYAPVGFLLDYRRVIPELAQHGRSQIDFSRSLGRAAIRTVAKSGREQVVARPERAKRASPSSPMPETEAVAGYDDMTAKQVLEILPDTSVAGRRWMLQRERAAKQRKTVIAGLERAFRDGDSASN